MTMADPLDRPSSFCVHAVSANCGHI